MDPSFPTDIRGLMRRYHLELARLLRGCGPSLYPHYLNTLDLEVDLSSIYAMTTEYYPGKEGYQELTCSVALEQLN